MTPEEKAVIQAAITERSDLGRMFARTELTLAVDALIHACPDCNRGGHVCPGDGNDIAHGEMDCGQHDDCSSEHGVGQDTCPKCWVRKNGGPRTPQNWDPDYPGCAPEMCGGSRLDPCLTVMRTKGARHDGDCIAEHRKGEVCGWCSEAAWMPATFGQLLPGDHVRIAWGAGHQEATVTRVHRGQWHAKDRQWFDDAGKIRDHMTPWEHEELRIDLTANPGMHVYPPDLACEILADAERAAILALQAGFPGSSSVVNWSA